MGTVDIARQQPNVFRMKLLGAEVRPVESGSRPLKDAINEAIRDWVTNVRDTHYLLGSALGPHPYPTIVRDFQAVIGHSFGTLITSFAILNHGFPAPTKLVYFGSFNRLMDSLPRFQAAAGLPDPVMDALRQMMYENLGRERLESISHVALAPQLDIPLLMFHDVLDEVTPITDSRALVAAWKGARLVETRGLGHRGALQSGDIHGQVIEFLKS